MKKTDKLFVVRKYVLADSIANALKKERKAEIYEVFVDDEWRKNNGDNLAKSMGYIQPK